MSKEYDFFHKGYCYSYNNDGGEGVYTVMCYANSGIKSSTYGGIVVYSENDFFKTGYFGLSFAKEAFKHQLIEIKLK